MDSELPPSVFDESEVLRRRLSQLAPADLTKERLGDALIRLRKAVDTMQLGVTIADPSGTIIYTNPADARMHGYEVHELIGKHVRILAPPAQTSPMTRNTLQRIHGWQREAVNVRKDGSTFPVHLMSDVVKNAQGEPLGVVTTCEDITDRKAVEQQLRDSAVRDPLTGLPNRTLLHGVLERALGRRARRDDQLFAVLFLDVNRFKRVNDSLGHAAGDELLKSIANRLQPHFRPSDTLARLGGDEFAVHLDDLRGESDAIRIAERIHAAFTDPFVVGGNELFVSCSIGIAFADPRYREPVEMIRDADIAMYRAKDAGEPYAVFDAAMHDRAVAVLQIETDLRWGIERNEFVTYYQPIVSLATGKVEGFEALVRWHHPEKGFLAPNVFIGVAEETGLVIPLGWWVLKDACQQARRWQRTIPGCESLYVSVNCSGKQLVLADVAERVAETLRATELSATSLRLEITETLLMEYSDRALDLLKQLRALGTELYMDDFGTGYSSLSYLHQFPISTVKIDRSFVGNMDERTESAEIVRTILDLSRSLNLKTVAEGVETDTHVRLLKALRCDYAQGYHFAKPLDAAAAEALLRSGLPT